MDEYYIRTPDRDESRGPFTPEQLLSLAEAEQVDINTLFYDDFKEEWIPIATNPELKEKVFPVREKLKLKVENTEEAPKKEEEKQSKKKTSKTKEKAQSTITNMLAMAENETKGVRRKRKREKSMERALFLSTNGLCLIMLLSAISILIPHFTVIKEIVTGTTGSPFLKLLNYPLILLGFLDLSLSVYTYFGDQKLNPILRARAMLAFGFGIYIGWALNDFYILSASAAFGIGILWTTLTRRFLFSIPAVALGFGGSAALAYLALSGNLNGVMEILHFEFFTSK